MNRDEHLWTIAAEEGAEVAQRATKILRFGAYEVQPDPVQNPGRLNNLERFVGEVNDLLAMVGVLRAAGYDMSMVGNEDALLAKCAKVEKFLDYSMAVGTLRT